MNRCPGVVEEEGEVGDGGGAVPGLRHWQHLGWREHACMHGGGVMAWSHSVDKVRNLESANQWASVNAHVSTPRRGTPRLWGTKLAAAQATDLRGGGGEGILGRGGTVGGEGVVEPVARPAAAAGPLRILGVILR